MSDGAEEHPGTDRAEAAAGGDAAEDGFGHLVVERSGGIGGFLLVWDIDVDASRHREEIGSRIAALPWESENGPTDAAAGGGADRFVYLIESRFGWVRFGESRMPEDFKRLIDDVRTIADPQRRRP